jgi:hypothetical protein
MLLSILRRLSNHLLIVFALVLSFTANAAITDIKFGQYQIADSQWNVSACLNTTTCQIYSKNPGVAYKIPYTAGQVVWAAGDYVKFDLSGNGSFPYTAKQYDSAGNVKSTLGDGKIVNMGPDYFFFVGSDNNTGQLFSGSSGMSDNSEVTWTGTLNPTIEEANAYADANYSTTPLAPGQTAQTNTPPTPVYGNSGLTAAQQSRLTAAIQNINVGQGNTIDATVQGDNNNIFITQAGGAHYLQLGIIGNQNTVNATQSSINYHNYLEINIVGNTNSIDVLQTGSNDKTAFVTVNGDYNTANVIQKDTGRHYLQLDLLSDGNIATIVQEGSGDHAATVTLNGSQPWNFNLNQSGAIGKTYTLPHAMSDGSSVSGTCNSIGGCNLTVNQQ